MTSLLQNVTLVSVVRPLPTVGNDSVCVCGGGGGGGGATAPLTLFK